MPNEPFDPTTKTVLLVDDEPVVLRMLCRVLELTGYRVICHSDPHEALATLETESVHVLVSDLLMPGVTGTELLSTARRKHPLVVRIALTGHASVDTTMRTVNDGEVYRILAKPIRAALLCAVVREAMDRQEELARIANLGAAMSHRARLLKALENEHPGITKMERDAGVYVIEGKRLDELEAKLSETTWAPLLRGRDRPISDTVRISGTPKPNGQ